MNEIDNKYKDNNHINKEELIKLVNIYNNKEKLVNIYNNKEKFEALNKIDIDLEHCKECNDCKKNLRSIMKIELELNEIIPRDYDQSSLEKFLHIMKVYGFSVTMVNEDTMEYNTFMADRLDEKGNLIFDDRRGHILDMPMRAFDLKNLYKFVIGDNSEEYGSIFKPIKHDRPVKNNPYEGFVFIYDSGVPREKGELILEMDNDGGKGGPPGGASPSAVMVKIVNGEFVYVNEEKEPDLNQPLPPSPGPSSPKKPEKYYEEKEVLIVGERSRELEENPILTIEPRQQDDELER